MQDNRDKKERSTDEVQSKNKIQKKKKRNLGRDKRFCFFLNHSDWLWGAQEFFPELKCVGLEGILFTACSAVVMLSQEHES